ncbi:XRE family transcriptional regulator [Mesorhizobium sp. B2-3-4]|uniref:XRE family transcriptional regulator n=1 Tax=Mesorhizobium sp. B2-3-4 TaxID=2589959 RepID=UPI00112D3EFC|nr:XRE family transcriptional regulator [Mesorhizobium sp. B2-3-4]TPM25726.1 XRE family transcriptional regulator [Mesorhizobium sp. B2-3-4]
MFRETLLEIRERLEVSQPTMAEAMGMPFRTYQAIEGGVNPTRPVHLRAAYTASMQLALSAGRPEMMPADLQELVGELGDMMRRP